MRKSALIEFRKKEKDNDARGKQRVENTKSYEDFYIFGSMQSYCFGNANCSYEIEPTEENNHESYK